MTRSVLRRRAAFTMVEVLLVIAILLVLGTVSVVALTRVKAGADRKNAQLMVNSTKEAVTYFHTAMNRYPSADEGLNALREPPPDEKEMQAWKDGGGPWLTDGKIPVDPWGNELKYEYIGPNDSGQPEFKIYSFGPDRTEGTEDDIKSWSEEQL